MMSGLKRDMPDAKPHNPWPKVLRRVCQKDIKAMDFNPRYIALLREFEGFYPQPYLCAAGACTIGYGTNLDANRHFIPWTDIELSAQKGAQLMRSLKNRGMRWSEKTAEEAMLAELAATDKTLHRKCAAYRILQDRGEDCRAHCLLDMGYNMGVASLLGFHETLPMIEKGQYERAAQNLKLSKWFRQVGRRGRAITAMIASGEYLAPQEVDRL